MAESYDGDIKLKVSLNATDTAKAANDLKKHFQEIFKAVEGQDVSVAFKRIQKTMADTMYKSDQLAKKMENLAQTKIETKEYKDLDHVIRKNEYTISKMNAQLEKMRSKGLEGTTGFTKLSDEIDKAADRMQQLIERREEMEKSGTAFTYGTNTEQYKQMVAQSATLNNQMRIQAQQADEELRNMGIDIEGDTSKFSTFMERFHAGMATVRERLAPVGQAFRNVGGAIANAANRVLQFAKNLAKAGLSKIKSMLSGMTKHSNGFNFSMKKAITTVLKYGLGIRSLYFAFRKLRSAVKDAFDLMAKKVPEVNKQLSAMKSSFQTFKNSLATAFQPLLSIVVPVVTKVMNAMTAATTKIGEFFAALTGQKYIYKATQANIDYAESLDKTKKAADNALGSYDKLDVISKDDKSNEDSDATTGTFEKVNVSQEVNDFMQRIKQAWEEGGDFTWLGNLLGTKLKEGLDKIPWDDIKENAKKAATALATLINGFVETEGLVESIGKTLGEAFNTAILALNTFLKKTDWKEVGEFIGGSIQSAIDTIDWEEVGETIANAGNAIFKGIQGIADKFDGEKFGKSIAKTINTAMTNFDWAGNAKAISDFALDLLGAFNKAVQNVKWEQLGENVATFITNIKWKELISGAFEAIGSLTGAFTAFIAGLFAQLMLDLKDYFTKHIDECKENGESVARGILLGIAEGLVNIGDWIKKNIFQPFIDGFKKAFGIASPAKEMKDPGEMIAQGILEGIMAPFKNILTWINEHIVTPFTEGLKKVADKFKINIFPQAAPDNDNSYTTTKTNLISRIGNAVKSVFTQAADQNDKSYSTTNSTLKTRVGTVDAKTEPKAADQNDKSYSSVNKDLKTRIGDVVAKCKGQVESVKAKAGLTLKRVIKGLKGQVGSIDAASNLNPINIKGAIHKGNLDTSEVENTEISMRAMPKLTTITASDGNRYPVVRRDDGTTGYMDSHGVWHTYNIPGYATGAVIPPNKEFLAVLGDQKQGVNIETPLATMIDAFKTALSEMGPRGGNGNMIVLQLDGKTVAQVVWDEEDKRYKQTGQFRPRTV